MGATEVRSGTCSSSVPVSPAALATYLAERSIGTGRHYPEPPHLSKAYAHLGLTEGSFPVAEQLAQSWTVPPDLSRV